MRTMTVAFPLWTTMPGGIKLQNKLMTPISSQSTKTTPPESLQTETAHPTSPLLVLHTCASCHPDVALNSDHIPITVRINKNADFMKADERTHTPTLRRLIGNASRASNSNCEPVTWANLQSLHPLLSTLNNNLT